MEAELIPGLPNDMALECLLRLPFHDLAGARRVCKRWRQEITSQSFYSLRKAGGHARPLVVLVPSSFYCAPRYKKLIIFDPTTAVLTRLPVIFNWSSYCRVAAVGHELVGLCGDELYGATVEVYNLLTGVRRRGATMPGPRRVRFAFAVTAEARMAYVAGGENEHREPLQSALSYDVAADAWVWLPDMARPRKECRGIFVNGAFCVAGGQGSHDWTFETFNVAEGRWTAKQVKLLEEALIDPSAGVAAVEGRVYTCRWHGEVDVISNDVGGAGVGGWQRLGVFSPNVYGLFGLPPVHLVAWNGGLMMLGITLQTGRIACILEEGKWRRMLMPMEFATGHVQSLCSFQL